MATASHDLAALVTALETAGARHVIVLGVVDMSLTPFGLALTDQQRAQLISLKGSFDSTLASDLAGRNLLYFDTGRRSQTIFANPLAYGFTNTTTPACPGSPPASAMVCQVPADGHMWADDKHPSSLLHGVISDWVYSSLEGASRAGLLSMLPLERSGTQWLAIDGQLQEFQNFGYRGQESSSAAIIPRYRPAMQMALLRRTSVAAALPPVIKRRFGPQLLGGATIGFNHAPFNLGDNQGSLKYDEWALAAFTSYKLGAAYANVLAGYSRLDFQSERNVVLGSFNTTERGGTAATIQRQRADRLQLRYRQCCAWAAGRSDVERVNVDGFSEDSGSVTAMAFGDQTRESLRSRMAGRPPPKPLCPARKCAPLSNSPTIASITRMSTLTMRVLSAGFRPWRCRWPIGPAAMEHCRPASTTELSPAIRLASAVGGNQPARCGCCGRQHYAERIVLVRKISSRAWGEVFEFAWDWVA